MQSLNHVGEDLLRQPAPQTLAAVLRRYGDFHVSEDAVQEHDATHIMPMIYIIMMI